MQWFTSSLTVSYNLLSSFITSFTVSSSPLPSISTCPSSSILSSNLSYQPISLILNPTVQAPTQRLPPLNQYPSSYVSINTSTHVSTYISSYMSSYRPTYISSFNNLSSVPPPPLPLISLPPPLPLISPSPLPSSSSKNNTCTISSVDSISNNCIKNIDMYNNYLDNKEPLKKNDTQQIFDNLKDLGLTQNAIF